MLTLLLSATEKTFAFGKCIGEVASVGIEKIEDKLTKYLQCDLKVIQSIENKSKQLIKNFSKTTMNALEKIQSVSGKGIYLNCKTQIIFSLFRVPENSANALMV